VASAGKRKSKILGGGYLIFTLVGTHPQAFDRLLKKIDELIESKKITESVIAQIGVSGYKPENYKAKSFFSNSGMKSLIKKSSLVISHAGAGTIITALRADKKIIVVPRLKKFGEHTNDHQLELARALEKEGKVIAVYKIENLGAAISAAHKFRPALGKESPLAKKLSAYLKSMEGEK